MFFDQVAAQNPLKIFIFKIMREKNTSHLVRFYYVD